MNSSSELLNGLSVEELEALADCMLSPSAQSRLSDLLARREAEFLPAVEEMELNRLLQNTDQLMLLKTRARYTLNRLKAEVAGT